MPIRPRLTILAVVALATTVLAACGTSAQMPSPTRIARIEVTPSALLLTGVDDSAVLSAQAFDAEGRPVETSFTFTSGDAGSVEVAEEGVVTSLVPVGSSQIVVSAGGVEATPVTVLVATPSEGAVLVRDAQIQEGPVVLNPGLDDVLGTRSEVVLADVPSLAPGTIVLARESAALAGKVVAATAEGAFQRVEVETVPLTDLFEAFDFSQTFALTESSVASMRLPADLSVATDADGKLLVSYSPVTGMSLQASRFACDGSAAPSVKLDGFTMTFKLDVKASTSGRKTARGGLEQMSFVVTGESSVVAKGGLFLEAGLKGDMTCTLKLYDMLLPVSGALSALVSPGLELVGELKVEGTVKAVTVEVGVTGSVGVKVQSGFTYRAVAGEGQPAGVTPVFQVDPILAVSPAYKAPSSYDARVDVGVFAGPALKLQARAVSVGQQSLLSVNLAEGRVGLRGDVSLAHHRQQASDAGYASAYDLKIRGQVGSGDGIQRILAALGVPGAWFEGMTFTFDSPALASSPTGSLTLSRSQALPGDEVEFEVLLDHVTFPFMGDNVNAVQIYTFQDGAAPTLLATIEPNASHQTRYTHTWTVPAGWSGDHHFVAFTDTVLAPGLPLEVAADSKRTLTVGGVCAPLPSEPTDPGEPTDPTDPTDPGAGGCTGTTSFASTWDYRHSGRQWMGQTTVTTSGYAFAPSDASGDGMAVFDLTGVTIAFRGEETSVYDTGLVCTKTYTYDGVLDAALDDVYATLVVYTDGIEGYVPQWAYTGNGSAAVEVDVTGGCDGAVSSWKELRTLVLYSMEMPTMLSAFLVQPGGVLTGARSYGPMVPVDGTYVHRSEWSFVLPGLRVE